MKFVRIGIDQFAIYEVKDFNNKELYTLAGFLLTEIRRDEGLFYLNWLNGEYNQDYAYGNIYGLIEEDDKVFVHLQPQFTKESHYYEAFVTTKQSLKEIIKQWTTFVATHYPKSFIIIQEGSNIHLQFTQ